MGGSKTELDGMRVALHACCGPCLLEPFDALVAEGARVVVVYYNPNIHPAEEYERRRDTLLEHAEMVGIEVEIRGYDPADWMEAVAGHARTREERCRACYRLRLGEVACWAAQNGFDAVASTLTVSPYQDAESISEEGHRACERAGLLYLERDYRERYGQATRRSREYGMYRQNYCGCLMSEVEASEERAARKARRQSDRSAQNS